MFSASLQYTPAAGDTFTPVIIKGDRIGDFANYNLPNLPANYAWDNFWITGTLYLQIVKLEVPQPIVVAVNPNSGPAGTLVTITGSGFSGGGAAVFFGAYMSTSVTVVSDNEIRATAPSGPWGTVDVVVSYPGAGKVSPAVPSDRYTYTFGMGAALPLGAIPNAGLGLPSSGLDPSKELQTLQAAVDQAFLLAEQEAASLFGANSTPVATLQQTQQAVDALFAEGQEGWNLVAGIPPPI